MNWQQIGASGEVLGALAVVLSLLCLAGQVRDSVAQASERTRPVNVW